MDQSVIRALCGFKIVREPCGGFYFDRSVRSIAIRPMKATMLNPNQSKGRSIADVEPSGTGHPAVRESSRTRLCVVVTVDITLLNLCRGRFEYLTENGFDVTAVCAPTPHAETIRKRGVRLFTFPLTRCITPWTDLRALIGLYRFFRRERFEIVEVSTPKAALLGSIAARLARVPCVVHLLRGLAYQGSTGLRLKLLKAAHRVPCTLAHHVISVSQQIRDQACGDGVCSPDRVTVLGAGSSNGVDLERFCPPDAGLRAKTRNELRFPDGAVVAGMCARLTGDKGVVELIAAFEELADSVPQLHLLLIGDYDLADRPPQHVMDSVRRHPRIRHVGWQEDTTRWMAVMDYFVMPTHREGLGTVLLEAAAMGLPVISTGAAGWWGPIEPGKDALCISAKSVPELRSAMHRLSTDAGLRERLGRAGRERVAEHFDCRVVWALQASEFRRLIGR